MSEAFCGALRVACLQKDMVFDEKDIRALLCCFRDTKSIFEGAKVGFIYGEPPAGFAKAGVHIVKGDFFAETNTAQEECADEFGFGFDFGIQDMGLNGYIVPKLVRTYAEGLEELKHGENSSGNVLAVINEASMPNLRRLELVKPSDDEPQELHLTPDRMPRLQDLHLTADCITRFNIATVPLLKLHLGAVKGCKEIVLPDTIEFLNINRCEFTHIKCPSQLKVLFLCSGYPTNYDIKVVDMSACIAPTDLKLFELLYEKIIPPDNGSVPILNDEWLRANRWNGKFYRGIAYWQTGMPYWQEYLYGNAVGKILN